MNNTYYTVITYIRQLIEQHGEVNTIIHARTEDKDLYKKNIYPLAHIVPLGAPLSSISVNQFNFDIAILDQREITSEQDYDKFDGNDNLIDNLTSTFDVLNYVVTKLQMENNDFQIEVVSVSDARPLLFKEYNIMDGWVVNITLQIPNPIQVC